MATFNEITRQLVTGELRLGPNDIQPQGNGNARQLIQRRFEQIAKGFALLRIDVRPFQIDAPAASTAYPIIVSTPKEYEVAGFSAVALAGTAEASLVVGTSGLLPGFIGMFLSTSPTIVRPGTFPLLPAGSRLSILFDAPVTLTNLTINIELQVP